MQSLPFSIFDGLQRERDKQRDREGEMRSNHTSSSSDLIGEALRSW